jgi:hypothetical protein
MGYDTGSTELTLFEDEVELMYDTQFADLWIPEYSILTAGGTCMMPGLSVDMRVIMSDYGKVLMDWQGTTATVERRTSGAARLSPKSFGMGRFSCMTPRLNLHVGVNKSQMVQEVPTNP